MIIICSEFPFKSLGEIDFNVASNSEGQRALLEDIDMNLEL